MLEFDELVSYLEDLKSASILQERDLVRSLLEPVSDENLPFLVSLLAGAKSGRGHVTTEVTKIAISRAYGSSIELVERKLREVGDLPGVAEILSERRQQKVIASEGHDAIYVLGELQKLLGSQISKKYKQARITNLLIDSPPATSRVIIEILLGQASAYVRKSVLIDHIARRFDADLALVRKLVERRGWYDSVEELLLGSSQGIVGRPCNGEKCRKGSTEEGDAQSEC